MRLPTAASAPLPEPLADTAHRLGVELRCPCCGASEAPDAATEAVRVRCNVREFAHQSFTVWRCSQCASLHCLEPIDYPRYYAAYPIRRQQYDFFTRRTFAKRLALLRESGLETGQSLLDYGCGSGHFVRYAREQGYDAEGYDPYSPGFADPAVLGRKYDLVTSQDVVEHVDDPAALIAELKRHVAPGGALAIGCPDAEAIDLANPLDHVGSLHQPYHRHIYSRRELLRALGRGPWTVEVEEGRWYVDTRTPFVNSAFLFRYMQSRGGVMDAGFDPVSPLHFLRHPSLLWHGLTGGWAPRSTDMLLIARKRTQIIPMPIPAAASAADGRSTTA